MNLPNLISLVRLLLVPVTVWLLVEGDMLAAFWVFVVAGLSDAVDGFIAKRFNQTTELGRYLDPLADKALLVSVYVTLGVRGVLPDWLVILVVSRDLLILGGMALALTLSMPLPIHPAIVSKVNTALQIVLAAMTLMGAAFALRIEGLTMPLVYAVAASTVLSGAYYLARWIRASAALGKAE